MKNGRIAIPTEGNGGLEAIRSGHFGHCSVFTLIDIKEGEIVNVETLPNQEHRDGGCLVPVNILANANTDVLIVGGMGTRPLVGFNQAGIKVFYETTQPSVRTALEMFLEGKLPEMLPQNACGGK
jgi:predicted Fe-Mo cluster-binding NifX family protein